MSSERDILDSLWPLTKHVVPVAAARIVAAIAYKGKIISVGFNQRKTHPLQKKYGKNPDAIFLHAEISAIIQARRELTLDELSKSTLYIIRRRMTIEGLPVYGNAKPCCGCLKAIKDFGIKKVIYSIDQEDFWSTQQHEAMK